jgi:hypothetical protein
MVYFSAFAVLCTTTSTLGIWYRKNSQLISLHLTNPPVSIGLDITTLLGLIEEHGLSQDISIVIGGLVAT